MTATVDRLRSSEPAESSPELAPWLDAETGCVHAAGAGGEDGLDDERADWPDFKDWSPGAKLLAVLGIVVTMVLAGALIYKLNSMTYAGYEGTSPDCKVVAFPTNIDRCLDPAQRRTDR